MGTSSIFGGLFHVSVSVGVKNSHHLKQIGHTFKFLHKPLFYYFCVGCVGVGVIGYAKGVGSFFVKDYLIFAEVVFNRSTFDFVQLAANF